MNKMQDLGTLDAEIRAKHRWQRFLATTPRDHARAAIQEIRDRDQGKSIKGFNTFGYSLDHTDAAIRGDPENARRYARITVADNLSMAKRERKRLEEEGVTEESAKIELDQWRARKKSLQESGFWGGLARTSKPEPFYYAEYYERTAENIKREYDI